MNDKIIMRQAYTPATLHVREASENDTPSRTIEGYAVLFDTPSLPMWQDEDGEAREVIASEAVTRSLLDGSDIKMTMFHDRQLLLARSNNGEGTLSYDIDERGVRFAFEAPNTADGDKALELVRRGDISGCSFAFSTRYYDRDCVERAVVMEDGKENVTFTVRAMTGIYDFTLTDNPAYPATSVEVRELRDGFRAEEKEPEPQENQKMREQVREMRCAARKQIILV